MEGQEGGVSRGWGRMNTCLLVHMVAWQKPIQHCTASILQLEKNKAKDEIQRFSAISETASSTKAHFSISMCPQAWRTAASFPRGPYPSPTACPHCLWPVDNVSQRISLIREVQNAATKENCPSRPDNNNVAFKQPRACSSCSKTVDNILSHIL